MGGHRVCNRHDLIGAARSKHPACPVGNQRLCKGHWILVWVERMVLHRQHAPGNPAGLVDVLHCPGDGWMPDRFIEILRQRQHHRDGLVDGSRLTRREKEKGASREQPL